MKYTIKLNKNKDFLSLYKKGKTVFSKACVVYYRRNNKSFNRIGITTGKKVGNAVDRSRARRIIRQAYRECEELFPKGYDFVIVARDYAAECKSTYVKSFLENKVIAMLKDEKTPKT
jgi:ribonuclease P protein component